MANKLGAICLCLRHPDGNAHTAIIAIAKLSQRWADSSERTESVIKDVPVAAKLGTTKAGKAKQ